MSEALAEAHDALEEAVAGRIADGEPIPEPSPRRAGEHFVTVPPDMAAKVADVIALRSDAKDNVLLAGQVDVHRRAAAVRVFGFDEAWRIVRRMLGLRWRNKRLTRLEETDFLAEDVQKAG